ncbi:MAG TPA: hypothetical protein VGG80_07565 [Acidobacteriaceae bacterium]|jgi:hypothetical protein
MTTVNPGPAQTLTPNSVLTTIPVNTQVNSNPVLTNALRLLGVVRGINLSVTGDTLLPILNASSYSVANIVVTNAQISGAGGSIASASIGVFTAAASGGTAIKAQAALASNTSQTVVFQATVASTALILPNTTPNLYVNCGTALANATADIFVYGYDLS